MQIAEERRQVAQKRSAAKVEKKPSNVKKDESKESIPASQKDTLSVAASGSSVQSKSVENTGNSSSLAPTNDEPKPPASRLSLAVSNLDVITEGVSDESEEGEEIIQRMDDIVSQSRVSTGSHSSHVVINHPDFQDGDDNNDNGNNNYMENRNRNNSVNKNWNNKDGGEGEEEDSTCVEVKTNCLYTCSSRLSKLNRFVINPKKGKHRFFDTIVSLTSVLVCWLVTYQAIFQNHHLALIIGSYMCDCLFWIEIYVNFHLSFNDEYGDLVDEFDVVSRNYMRTLDQFLLDLISVLPLEIFAFAAPSEYRMLTWSYLRLTRLVRFHHISRFFNKREQQLDVK